MQSNPPTTLTLTTPQMTATSQPTSTASTPTNYASPTMIHRQPPSATQGLRLLLLPYRDPNRAVPSATFEIVERQITEGCVIKIGRQVRVSEPLQSMPQQQQQQQQAEDASPTTAEDGRESVDASLIAALNGMAVTATVSEPMRLPPLPTKQVENVWFKSKVVSRNHAELWFKEGQVYLRDTGSSSGTFLNMMRLSPSSKISRPYPLREGDIIQLGVDYQGRPEDIYKCVIMKISMTGISATVSQRKKDNPARFRAALKTLLNATNPYSTTPQPPSTPLPIRSPQQQLHQPPPPPQTPLQTISLQQPSPPLQQQPNTSVDCCICLCAIGPYQALFLAPCSHCYHHKCVRNLLDTVMFQCPMCRQVANLDASVSRESLCDEDCVNGGGVAGDDVVRSGGMWSGVDSVRATVAADGQGEVEGERRVDIEGEDERADLSIGNLQGLDVKAKDGDETRS